MAIYGTGYRALEYAPTPRWRRLWPIAGYELRALFRRRLGVVLFLLCMIPAVANLGILLAWAGVWQLGAGDRLVGMARFDPTTLDFYITPTVGEVPSFVVFLILSTLVSCRAIAKDRETAALEIYWTRGVRPLGYFAAKWLGSFLLIGLAFVLAPAVTWGVGAILAPDGSFWQQTSAFMPRVLLALTLFTAVLTFVAVGFSAIADNANGASLLWFVVLLGTTAVVRVLSRVFQGEWALKAINPWDAMKRIAEWISGATPVNDYSPGYALASIVVLVGVTGVVASRRLTEHGGVG